MAKQKHAPTPTSAHNGVSVDYTDDMIRDVLINGIANSDIRLDILGTANILSKSINELIALVEGKEISRHAVPASDISAMSSWQSQKVKQVDPARQANCPQCNKVFKQFTEGRHGWNKKPHKMCIECFRGQRIKNSNRQKSSPPAASSIESETITQVGSVECTISASPSPNATYSVLKHSSQSYSTIISSPRVNGNGHVSGITSG